MLPLDPVCPSTCRLVGPSSRSAFASTNQSVQIGPQQPSSRQMRHSPLSAPFAHMVKSGPRAETPTLKRTGDVFRGVVLR